MFDIGSFKTEVIYKMNTNIDDYSNDELVQLLQLSNTESYEEPIVRGKIAVVLSSCKNMSEEMLGSNSVEELIEFFKKCYLRLSVIRNFPIPDEAKEQLGLKQFLPSVPDTSQPRVVHDLPYEDSLPQPLLPWSVFRSKPTKFALGNVNPVDRETITYMLILNSKFRTNTSAASYSVSQSDRFRSMTLNQPNYVVCKKITTIAKNCPVTKSGDIGTVSDFTVELNSPYKDAISLKVAALTFDNNYYPISEYLGSNIFTITSFDYDPTAPNPSATIANVNTTDIVLDDGYYTSAEIGGVGGVLNSQFIASPIGGLAAVEIVEFTTRNKFVFRVNGTPPIPPPAGRQYGFNLSFINNNYPNRPLYENLGWALGYRDASYNFFRDYNTVATPQLEVGFNPEACLNLNGTTSFFLEVNDYNNNHPRVIDYNCNTSNSYNLNNLLSRIPNVTPFATQIYEDSSDRVFKQRNYFGPVTISKLRIRLLDDNGVPVNLNGGSFTLNLAIEALNKSTKNVVL